ncbi:hypothetical protein HY771_00720 [Candidatus Uhrbacteria bacterium]|nr:hypothetical protein [Candidatus Uhrbacteria bacterium]
MSSPFELILKSVRLYRTNAATFLGYSAWLLIPFAGAVILGLLPLSPFAQLLAFLLMLVELFLSFWVVIILVLCADALLTGKKFEHGRFPKIAKTLIAPVLTVALLQTLILIGGLLLLVVPGFLFFVWFSFAQFTAILDGKRGLDALQTSKAMIKGKFWKVFLTIFGGTLFLFIVYSLILSLIMSLIAALQGVDLLDMLTGTLPLWIQVLESIGEVILLPLLVIFLTSVYLEVKSGEVVESKSQSHGVVE